MVSVQYALEGSIEKNVEVARITPVQIPQHASVRPPQQTTIATSHTTPNRGNNDGKTGIYRQAH
jgi:hypothetical protein